jgi:hypothetical protein
MPRTQEQIRETRRQLREEYRELYDPLLALLFRADPIGINFEVNTDEYAPEVGTILPRLKSCTSADDVLQVVHEEFVRWFDPETAGSRDHYWGIAGDVWKLWEQRTRSL